MRADAPPADGLACAPCADGAPTLGQGAGQVLLVTAKSGAGAPEPGQGLGEGDGRSEATVAAAAAAAASGSVLAALPAWGAPILLPRAWGNRLAALAAAPAVGAADSNEGGAGAVKPGPVFTIWLSTARGPAVTTLSARQLLEAAGSGQPGLEVRATLLAGPGRQQHATAAAGAADAGGSAGGGRVAAQQGLPELPLQLLACLRSEAGGSKMARDPGMNAAAGGAPGTNQGSDQGGARRPRDRRPHPSKRSATDKTKRCMRRVTFAVQASPGACVVVASGGTVKMGAPCWWPPPGMSEAAQARVLGGAALLAVVAAAWLHLLIGGPTPAAATLKAVAFLTSVVFAMALLPVLAKLPPPAPPPPVPPPSAPPPQPLVPVLPVHHAAEAGPSAAPTPRGGERSEPARAAAGAGGEGSSEGSRAAAARPIPGAGSSATAAAVRWSLVLLPAPGVGAAGERVGRAPEASEASEAQATQQGSEAVPLAEWQLA